MMVASSAKHRTTYYAWVVVLWGVTLFWDDVAASLQVLSSVYCEVFGHYAKFYQLGLIVGYVLSACVMINPLVVLDAKAVLPATATPLTQRNLSEIAARSVLGSVEIVRAAAVCGRLRTVGFLFLLHFLLTLVILILAARTAALLFNIDVDGVSPMQLFSGGCSRP